MKFAQDRKFNVITVGRANLDLYPPVGEVFETARHYDAYVGGSPANIAVGISKLGLKSAIISRVADDPHGHFVAGYLQKMGVDTAQMQYDQSGAKTSVAFAERKPDSRLCMYRNNAADLLLDASEVDDGFVESSQSLVMTGFSFAHETSRQACFTLLERATAADVVKVFDIDYRPYNWQSSKIAEEIMTKAASSCDIIFGTRAEFEVTGAKASDSDADCAKRLLDKGAKIIILKRDKDGSTCFTSAGDIIETSAFIVDLVKPFGAGDSFAAAFLSSLMKNSELKEALQFAAAAASINISGTSCTEAMPTIEQIKTFIDNYK